MFKRKQEHETEKHLYGIVSSLSETGFSIYVKKWARSNEVEKVALEKYGIPETTTRMFLQDMVKKHQLQTAVYGGGRFYAEFTMSPLYIVAVAWSFALIFLSILMLNEIDWRISPFVLSPLLLAVVWRSISKRMDKGICLGCGKSIKKGELYCSKKCRRNSKGNNKRKLTPERIWEMYNEERMSVEDIVASGVSASSVKSVIEKEVLRRHGKKCGEMDCWTGMTGQEWGTCKITGKQRSREQYICEEKI